MHIILLNFLLTCAIHFDMQVSAFLEIHDIAGLVRGAHEGQGLGNSFLSHIRAVDGIFHVLRKMFLLSMHYMLECCYLRRHSTSVTAK